MIQGPTVTINFPFENPTNALINTPLLSLGIINGLNFCKLFHVFNPFWMLVNLGFTIHF